MSSSNAVFYADAYHPIQAGSIDDTDILPHDNTVYRAVLCSSADLCNEQVRKGEEIATSERYWFQGLNEALYSNVALRLKNIVCKLGCPNILRFHEAEGQGLLTSERDLDAGMSSSNAVFYADAYHPIQAGSIDGTDILPHDNAVYRAVLCSSAGLYDPLGDPKVIGDPYCTVFVGRLSRLTEEETLRKAMNKYGRVKKLRLVRDIGNLFQGLNEALYSNVALRLKNIGQCFSPTYVALVTGASCGYAFVEFETEREMRRAYEDAHHSFIDDCEVIVDYYRQHLMPGWIPRRLGGGLGGKKESGQLRFGGRERPFRAPLRPIPYDDLKRLGIPPPPEGRYVTRFQLMQKSHPHLGAEALTPWKILLSGIKDLEIRKRLLIRGIRDQLIEMIPFVSIVDIESTHDGIRGQRVEITVTEALSVC
ncbi:hypothetical protein ZIOFF_059547 [Zingiber officinale]|uniref:RRM domain-containing protein n=1 Tax=Zingiber officinale TaxID=94328 RepID=A0A8J5FAF2_ZINOF|nr:hypothetical protein ZIOFF_059547 [Zingiber officinale]